MFEILKKRKENLYSCSFNQSYLVEHELSFVYFFFIFYIPYRFITVNRIGHNYKNQSKYLTVIFVKLRSCEKEVEKKKKERIAKEISGEKRERGQYYFEKRKSERESAQQQQQPETHTHMQTIVCVCVCLCVYLSHCVLLFLFDQT